MEKEELVKDDGRLLIFYTFPPDDAGTNPEPSADV